MEDAERFRLLGKYRTPRFRRGQRVRCLVRGEMVITGMTDAPIPWPIGKGYRGRHSLIVYKDLAKAIRRESNQAISHWWGVDLQTVTRWRRSLGEVTPLDVLGDDVAEAVLGAADVVDWDDARVVEMGQSAGLAQVLLDVVGAGDALGAGDFDGHVPVEILVVGEVDAPEASLA